MSYVHNKFYKKKDNLCIMSLLLFECLHPHYLVSESYTWLCLLLFSGIPYITDCVMGELEKLGSKYRVALRLAKDPRFERLPCTHKGTYADDCIVNRVTQVKAQFHKCRL